MRRKKIGATEGKVKVSVSHDRPGNIRDIPGNQMTASDFVQDGNADYSVAICRNLATSCFSARFSS